MHPQQFWRPVVAMAALVAATMLATTTVVVEPGDTLSAIAEQHDVTVGELVEWNDIADPDRIVAGTTLLVAAPDGDAAVTLTDTAEVHVVTAGDTLSAIARRYGATVAALAAANDLEDVDRIYAGQQLRLRATPPATTTTTTTTPTRTYTVRLGDTLSAIARQHGVSIDVLARLNDLDDVDRIREGDSLRVDDPNGSATADAGTSVDTATPTPAPTTTVPSSTVPPTTTTTPAPTPTAPPVAPVDSGGGGRDADEVLLAPRFAHWADTYAVPQDLLEAIAWKESNWQPDAVGPTGNLGLMQLSPATVELIEGGLLGRDLDPLDADDALQMGARFLRYLIDRTESEDEAVAAWRQGLASVQGDGITTAGAGYVAAITEIRQLRG